jgi:glycosyltransferase involved in cell wall biosynthesis
MTNEPNASSAAASAEPIAISVVTPMHNEELCVEEFLRRTDAALRAIGRTHEIVIVSDGSTVRTEELLRAATVRYPSLRALFLARNVGQCSALYAGIQASRGRVVVVADGDLQHRPEDIHLLIAAMDKGVTLVSGSRGDRSHEKLSKRLPSRIANKLLRAVTGCDIRDMGAGKRDRERPHHKPSSTSESFFYRGLLAKAFFDSSKGSQEFAYIPDDLLEIIVEAVSEPEDVPSTQKNDPLGRPATPVEKAFEIPATDFVLDDATTYLAAMRIGDISRSRFQRDLLGCTLRVRASPTYGIAPTARLHGG